LQVCAGIEDLCDVCERPQAVNKPQRCTAPVRRGSPPRPHSQKTRITEIFFRFCYYAKHARVAELVDARDLKSLAALQRRAGSIPAPSTARAQRKLCSGEQRLRAVRAGIEDLCDVCERPQAVNKPQRC